MNDAPMANGADKPALVVGILLLFVAAVIYYDASQQTITSNYGLGPTAMPYVACTGLTLLGLAHFIVAFRGGLPKPETADRAALFWIAAGMTGLVGSIALNGGFVLATTLVFACTARGFGRRAFLIDAVIGFVLGLVIFLTFAKVLTLILPAGPFEQLFL